MMCLNTSRYSAGFVGMGQLMEYIDSDEYAHSVKKFLSENIINWHSETQTLIEIASSERYR